MKFSVIYSIDVPEHEHLSRYFPSNRHLFRKTEGKESYDYDYLGGEWKNGSHGKYVALLTKYQFDKFISSTGLYAEDCETMGSLGALGFGYGWSPAISFTADEYDALLNAYVTPIPEIRNKKTPFDDREWQRLRKVIIARYN